MRRSVHDTVARFRVNEQLLAQAEIAARKQGMSLSELIRAAVRDKVGELA